LNKRKKKDNDTQQEDQERRYDKSLKTEERRIEEKIGNLQEGRRRKRRLL
jgi:hypothetical protein